MFLVGLLEEQAAFNHPVLQRRQWALGNSEGFLCKVARPHISHGPYASVNILNKGPFGDFLTKCGFSLHLFSYKIKIWLYSTL